MPDYTFVTLPDSVITGEETGHNPAADPAAGTRASGTAGTAPGRAGRHPATSQKYAASTYVSSSTVVDGFFFKNLKVDGPNERSPVGR